MTKSKPSPRVEREVREHVHRKDDGNAFIVDPEGGEAHSSDSLAENLAEAYLQTATSGEEAVEDVMNEVVPEELGGPFVEEDMEIVDTEVVPPPPTTSRRRRHR
jgi:hypothetical protein